MRETDHEPPSGPNEPPSGLNEPPTKPADTRGVPEPDAATQDDAVTEASEESFPASDAPPWTSSAT